MIFLSLVDQPEGLVETWIHIFAEEHDVGLDVAIARLRGRQLSFFNLKTFAVHRSRSGRLIDAATLHDLALFNMLVELLAILWLFALSASCANVGAVSLYKNLRQNTRFSL